mmetsp:Transcript_68944/g.183680  ORF Transcript_68944/g.183680 Transcript_68944/m.183680 type:complete len:382 (-) Transcript_68944:115-1260(-)
MLVRFLAIAVSGVLAECRQGYLTVDGVRLFHDVIPEGRQGAVDCPKDEGYHGFVYVHCYQGHLKVIKGTCVKDCEAGKTEVWLGGSRRAFNSRPVEVDTPAMKHGERVRAVRCPGSSHGLLDISCVNGAAVASGICNDNCDSGSFDVDGVAVPHGAMEHGQGMRVECGPGITGAVSLYCANGRVSGTGACQKACAAGQVSVGDISLPHDALNHGGHAGSEQKISMIMDYADVRRIGVLNFAALVVTNHLAASDLSGDWIQRMTQQAFDVMAKGLTQVSAQTIHNSLTGGPVGGQVAQACGFNVGEVCRSFPQDRPVSIQEFQKALSGAKGRGFPFAVEVPDKEDDYDEDDLDELPILERIQSRMESAFNVPSFLSLFGCRM